jgi:hypothetical protein
MKLPTKSQLIYHFGEGVDTIIAYVDLDYRLNIYPRSKYNLFEYEMEDKTENGKTFKVRVQPEKIKKIEPMIKYLENFKGEEGKIKDIEKRMYLDICSKYPDQKGSYYCFKVITVLMEKYMGDDLKWHLFDPGPYSLKELEDNEKDSDDKKYHKSAMKSEQKNRKKVEIKFDGGSKKARFLYNGKLEETIIKDCDGIADRNGLFELTIVHPVEDVAEADRKIKIKVTIKDSKDKKKTDKEIELELVRNKWKVTELDKIGKRGTEEKADNILVYQPVNPETENKAIKDLQKICNQVISRNRNVDSYEFLLENGIYNKETKKAINQYITGFKNIKKGSDANKDYPYSLECIGENGIDGDLARHINDEYLLSYKNNMGIVVDRHLLIGKKAGTSLKDTDGLEDLYENVVKKYIKKVVDLSEDYRKLTTPWFHDPDQSDYFKMGDVTLETDKYQYKTALGDEYVTKKDKNKNDVPDMIKSGSTISHSDFQTHKGNNKHRFSVNHNNGTIWIELTESEVNNRDDREIAENKGNYGTAFQGYDYTNYGISYCNDGKNSRERYENRIKHIDDQYKNWNKYPDTDMVDTDKYNTWENGAYGRITGLDCTGFVQNCITHILFDEEVDGKNYRIVPDIIIPQYKYSKQNGIDNCPGANFPEPDNGNADLSSTSLNIGGTKAYASSITIDTQANSTKDRRCLMTRGDVIVTNVGHGHIVLVTVNDENYPCAGDQRENRNFAITHCYGMNYIYTGDLPPKPAKNIESYFRKTLRSPFIAWGIQWANVYLGRIMIWE